jgi:hypothetical protein
MEGECCGKVREGNFCSECGKPIEEDDLTLTGLLRFCRDSEASLGEAERDASRSGMSPSQSRAMAFYRARWKAWGDLLDRLRPR